VASPHDAAETSRRSFLAQVIGACVAFLAALLGIPAVGATVGPALKREETEWLSLGSPDSFQEGVPKAVNLTVVSRDGWIETNTAHATRAYLVATARCWPARRPGHWTRSRPALRAATFRPSTRISASAPPTRHQHE
jgi:hypothetical protein